MNVEKADAVDEFARSQIIGTDGIFFRSEGLLREN